MVTNLNERMNVRLDKNVRADINKILCAFPEQYTSESEFIRIAIMKEIRNAKEQAKTYTYRERGLAEFSPTKRTSHVNTPSLSSQSFNSQARMGVEVQETKKQWLTQQNM